MHKLIWLLYYNSVHACSSMSDLQDYLLRATHELRNFQACIQSLYRISIESTIAMSLHAVNDNDSYFKAVHA